jgi:hypothetical protein
MDSEKRWRCPIHPDTTVGQTMGETNPPICTQMFCNRPMELVADPRVQHRDDSRARRPPRPGGRPL